MHNKHLKHCMCMNSRLERDTPSFSGFHLLEEGMGKLLSFFFSPFLFSSLPFFLFHSFCTESGIFKIFAS